LGILSRDWDTSAQKLIEKAAVAAAIAEAQAEADEQKPK
jgi:hypothetical protein